MQGKKMPEGRCSTGGSVIRQPAYVRPYRALALYHERGLTRPQLCQVCHHAREAAISTETADLLRKLLAWREAALSHIADLTPREHEIMDLVLAGQPSKNIAVDLGISQRTVENHRASIMKKTGMKSLPALARLVFVAKWIDAAELSLVTELSSLGGAPARTGEPPVFAIGVAACARTQANG